MVVRRADEGRLDLAWACGSPSAWLAIVLGALAISGVSSARTVPSSTVELGIERAAASALTPPDAAEPDELDHERPLPLAALGLLAPPLARAFVLARPTRADAPFSALSAPRTRPPNCGPPAA